MDLHEVKRMENRNVTEPGSGKSQFGLMSTRRFAPFFWTQFLGAFNDNVFRNGLMIMIAYGAGRVISGNSNIWINVAAGLFILPFFLFSAMAGQLADKFEKSVLIQWIKIAEIVIMSCAAITFLFENCYLLILLLFLMGSQSAFFGPIKYSIIPDHLAPDEIIGGNAMVEMGTFVAILLGLVTGNLLNPIQLPPAWIGVAVILIASAGWLASREIPRAAPPSPDLKIDWNPFTQTWETIQFARKKRSVYLSILAISWFWFLGMAYLTQLPNFTRQIMASSEDVYTLLLTIFSAGIGIGSLLCEKLSDRKIELGLVPLGTLGITLFGIDLFFAYNTPTVSHLMGIHEFLRSPGSIHLIVDFTMIGIFGGFYIVPLFAFVQMWTPPEYRARVIAANNILNALFMVIAAVAGGVLIGVAGLTIPQFFFAMIIANILITGVIFILVPEFVMRFLIWIAVHTFCRVRHEGLDRVPDQGGGVLVCDSARGVDVLRIAGASRRPIRFVVPGTLYNTFFLYFIFRIGRAIPVARQSGDEGGVRQILEKIAAALDNDELICILTGTPKPQDRPVAEITAAIEKMIAKNRAPVIPLALSRTQGWLSGGTNKASSGGPGLLGSRALLSVGEAVVPPAAAAKCLYEKMQAAAEATG